ncbi:MAG: DUF87 domain-containing protein, partial [Desulfurococcaceae archaeon]
MKSRYPRQNVLIANAQEIESSFIDIGEILNTVPKQVAKITRDALFRHILIVGTTGAGKSYTAATISKRIVKVLSIPVLIVDWHNEYTKLL